MFSDLGVHNQSHNGDEEWRALSIDNVDQDHSVRVTALVLTEGVKHSAGHVDAHGGHPEEDSYESVVNEVTQSHTATRLLIVNLVVLKENQSTKTSIMTFSYLHV